MKISNPAGDWISVKEALPPVPDWYTVMANSYEFEAPYVTKMGGGLTWVVPEGLEITHWKKNLR